MFIHRYAYINGMLILLNRGALRRVKAQYSAALNQSVKRNTDGPIYKDPWSLLSSKLLPTTQLGTQFLTKAGDLIFDKSFARLAGKSHISIFDRNASLAASPTSPEAATSYYFSLTRLLSESPCGKISKVIFRFDG